MIHTVGVAEYSASKKIEIEAKRGIHLRCGRSVIAVLPDRITLCSPEIGLFASDAKMVLAEKKARIVAKDFALVQAKETHLRGEGATLELSDKATLQAVAINLKGGTPPQDVIDGPGRRRLTKIELKDQDGQPLPYERFVVKLTNGSERVGVLDENGKAELEIQGGGSAHIVFPDLMNVEAQ